MRICIGGLTLSYSTSQLRYVQATHGLSWIHHVCLMASCGWTCVMPTNTRTINTAMYIKTAVYILNLGAKTLEICTVVCMLIIDVFSNKVCWLSYNTKNISDRCSDLHNALQFFSQKDTNISKLHVSKRHLTDAGFVDYQKFMLIYSQVKSLPIWTGGAMVGQGFHQVDWAVRSMRSAILKGVMVLTAHTIAHRSSSDLHSKR